MKILLVTPYVSKKKTYSSFSLAAPTLPPLGLAYLANSLLKNGHDVRILDAILEQTSESRLIEVLKKFSPNIIGISAVTHQFPAAKHLSDIVKKYDKKIITVIGGPHISNMPKRTMEEAKNIDYGVIGEGEISFPELIKKIMSKSSIKQVKGIIYRKKGKIIQNSPRPLVKNIDKMGFPARHLLRDLKYYSHTPFRGRGIVTSVITSRGCPFNCYYCDQSVFGRTYRFNSAQHILKELKELKEKYGIVNISFEDDNFALDKKRTIELCKGIIKDKLNISWACELRVTSTDEELVYWMKKAGCWSVYFGIESGDPKMLKFINKNQTIEQVRKAIRIAKKYGLKVTGSFILGLPRETKESINKTISLALSLPIDGVTFHLFTPYPNTPLEKICRQYGKVRGGWGDYAGHSGIVTYIANGFSEKELLKIQKRAYRKFLLRPRYIIKNLGKLSDLSLWKKMLAGFIFETKPKISNQYIS